ncbi:MAG TPA: glycosyltransferase family 1 protein [Solirubrobacterales bacterium]|nr:glycosyltransferase family 1 protein [Solirubrobacterales bacterium]
MTQVPTHGGPLRVCVDARLAGGRFGGVEQAVIGIAAGLSKLTDGDEEYLFLIEPENEEWLRPHLRGPCRPLHPRRGRAVRRAVAAARAVAERLPAVGPRFAARPSDGTIEAAGVDVVHFPIQDALITDLPSIYEPHDLLHLHLPENFSRWERRRREVVYRTHCARAERVVAMTSWGRRDLIESYALAPEKVDVVPWASVLPEYPAPTDPDLEGIRADLDLQDGFLLYPAQTWAHKNHERLLEALALIARRDGLEIGLVCPGRQNRHFRRIRERIGELGLERSVRFPGFVSELELRAFYDLATALVFPSLFEGWGLPVCEAFSVGLPVACSTATSLPDLVGDAGLLFDPDDPDAIADCVLRLWTDAELRATLAERGRERSDLFSFERTARLFRAHYRQVARRPLSDEDRILLANPPLA